MNRQEFDTIGTHARTSELEKLLDIAEDLKEKCEAKGRMIEKNRVAQVGVSVIQAFLVLAWIEIGVSFGTINLAFYAPLAGLLFSLAASILAFEFLIRRRKAEMKPDLIALSELIQLIRETEPAMAESEHWSTIERAQFRIRLSRFGIGARSY